MLQIVLRGRRDLVVGVLGERSRVKRFHRRFHDVDPVLPGFRTQFRSLDRHR